MDSIYQQRFKDADWFPKEDQSVLIGGAGGIGSWLSFFLSKIGYNIYLFDFDTVEEHNLGGQLFMKDAIGKYKVDAIQDILEKFGCGKISTFKEEVKLGKTSSHKYCFSAFDNMAARRELFDIWKTSFHLEPGVTPLFIDGRLEMEQLQIFCVTPETADQYERDYLFSDAEGNTVPCTMKQSSHTAAMIGTFMTAFFTNHMANTYTKSDFRELPFFFEYSVPWHLIR
jgi:molybdopterin/thiamine biosynthesis adenylyltransferase